jgi:hypothetical protein
MKELAMSWWFYGRLFFKKIENHGYIYIYQNQIFDFCWESWLWILRAALIINCQWSVPVSNNHPTLVYRIRLLSLSLLYYKSVSGKHRECKFLSCQIFGEGKIQKIHAKYGSEEVVGSGVKRASVILWWNRGFFRILSCFLCYIVIRVLREGLLAHMYRKTSAQPW